MRFFSAVFALATILASVPLARAADVVTTPRVEVRLVAETTGIPASGGTISIGLIERMQPEWHTYWRNPGESGEPTTIDWLLPRGFRAGDIMWPRPERIAFGELANYGFGDEVLLRSEITIPAGLTVGTTVSFTAHAKWLVCKDICIPEEATLDLALPVVAAPALNDQWREIFAKYREREPQKIAPFDARFALEDDAVTLFFRSALDQPGAGALFFPFTKGLLKASAPQVVEQRAGGFAITVPPGWRLRDPEKRKETSAIDGVLVLANPVQAFEVSLKQGDVPAGVTTVAAADLPLMQAILDRYKTGIQISKVNMQNAQPPEQVQNAFADVQKAGQDRERLKNEGEAYFNDVVPKARGVAQRLELEAEGYRSRVIATAEGDASRFKQVLTEYAKAPAVTRERIYIETMQQIFSSTSKVMLDYKGSGNLLYLPLDKLMQQSGAPLEHVEEMRISNYCFAARVLCWNLGATRRACDGAGG